MRQSVVMDHDQLWEAVERRDRSRDGEFYFGVLTTGVYCRPSCPGRRPLRQNVRFYRTPQEAERDGLRACKRCRPLETEPTGSAAKIRELCRYIQTHPDESPDLADLAARAGLSRFHLQRSFKAAVGLTPKQYVDACRLRKLKQSLRESRGVAGAVYDAGYGSSSRVYERADTRLGMTPNQYRKEGRGVTITYVAVESPVGLMMIGATDRGLCSIQFGDTEGELVGLLRKEYPAAVLEPTSARVSEMDGRAVEPPGRDPAAPGAAAGHSSHGFSDAGLELFAIHSVWRGAVVRRSGGGDRPAFGSSGRGAGVCHQSRGPGDSVPPGDSRVGRDGRISLGRGAEARAHRPGAGEAGRELRPAATLKYSRGLPIS